MCILGQHPCSSPMATFLPCMLAWESGNPTPALAGHAPYLKVSWMEVDGITLQDLGISKVMWGY